MTDWFESNQIYLSAMVDVVGRHLDRVAAGESVEPASAVAPLSPPSALDGICTGFGLSTFERDILLLGAGTELQGGFGTRCAAAHGDPRRTLPTFGLALAALPDAHWSALSPDRPLRRWRLIDVGPGDTLTSSMLRIDERVLHHLTGVSHLDERLRGLVHSVPSSWALALSHREVAARVAGLLQQTDALVQVIGMDAATNRSVAAEACATSGFRIHTLRATDIPVPAAERYALARLWERESVLSGSALLVEFDDHEGSDGATAFIEDVRASILVASREPITALRRPSARVQVTAPGASERLDLWKATLGPAAVGLNGGINTIAAQFQLGLQGIRAAGAAVAAGRPDGDDRDVESLLWDECRAQASSRLHELAQRIVPHATWDDLVLPEAQLETLHEISAHVRHRTRVYEDWGFAAKSDRGLGICALFSGASGTGKTMAAEVLANDLRLDLHRIDLSQVVSKYIGETEKNLRRVFDAAEAGGSILLFDEADALFGKRSEVKDSHDRYANIEVSYLLQRMEAYRGLAILTTNMKSALDPAFLRRIRFVVQFPFPDAEQRVEIWRRTFPASTPTARIDFGKLARLNVTGGNIRNIALHAAFLAADEDAVAVGMGELLRAARSECAKIERPLPDAEVRDWT